MWLLIGCFKGIPDKDFTEIPIDTYASIQVRWDKKGNDKAELVDSFSLQTETTNKLSAIDSINRNV